MSYLSRVQYTGTGAVALYSIPFAYISKAYIEVRVDGVLLTEGVDFSWQSATSISLTAGNLPIGVVLDIRRATPKTFKLVDFNDGSVLTEAALDLANDQVFHLVGENVDDMADKVSAMPDGTVDMKNLRVKNMGTPLNATDGVNKEYADETVSRAEGAAITAEEASYSATSSASTATTAAIEASSSASFAATKADEAKAARDSITFPISVSSGGTGGVTPAEARAGLGLGDGGLPNTANNPVVLGADGKLPALNAANLTNTPTSVFIRQTVLSGPVDANGAAAFGGATGSTTVTATGTLVATAANGFSVVGQVDRTGSIVNPSWTGLSTNGTAYLYLDIAADGSCTPGKTMLAPVYQAGSSFSVTSGQFTFSTQMMVGKVGDGSAANQAYRIFVGECLVTGGVVTAITWYSLRGHHKFEQITLSSSTPYSFKHAIGVSDLITSVYAECKTSEFGYAVGDRIYVIGGDTNLSAYYGGVFWTTNITCGFTTYPGLILSLATNKATGVAASLTMANWKIGGTLKRAW